MISLSSTETLRLGIEAVSRMVSSLWWVVQRSLSIVSLFSSDGCVQKKKKNNGKKKKRTDPSPMLSHHLARKNKKNKKRKKSGFHISCLSNPSALRLQGWDPRHPRSKFAQHVGQRKMEFMHTFSNSNLRYCLKYWVTASVSTRSSPITASALSRGIVECVKPVAGIVKSATLPITF